MILHPLRRGFHGSADIHRPEVEGHRARIDRGEVENVVGDGEQRVGRCGDVAEVFALFFRERAGVRNSTSLNLAKRRLVCKRLRKPILTCVHWAGRLAEKSVVFAPMLLA